MTKRRRKGERREERNRERRADKQTGRGREMKTGRTLTNRQIGTQRQRKKALVHTHPAEHCLAPPPIYLSLSAADARLENQSPKWCFLDINSKEVKPLLLQLRDGKGKKSFTVGKNKEKDKVLFWLSSHNISRSFAAALWSCRLSGRCKGKGLLRETSSSSPSSLFSVFSPFFLSLHFFLTQPCSR